MQHHRDLLLLSAEGMVDDVGACPHERSSSHSARGDNLGGMPSYRLHMTPALAETRGILLLLHGGPEKGTEPVSGTRGAFVQIEHLRRRVGPRVAKAGVATWSLQNGVVGWNDEESPAPVADARAALAEAQHAHPGVPIVLIGHSMGGRAAIQAADHENVVGVVGLSPWVPKRQSPEPLRAKHLAIAHIKLELFPECRPADVRRFARSAEGIAKSIVVKDMGFDIHVMLLEERWHEFARKRGLRMLNSS